MAAPCESLSAWQHKLLIHWPPFGQPALFLHSKTALNVSLGNLFAAKDQGGRKQLTIRDIAIGLPGGNPAVVVAIRVRAVLGDVAPLRRRGGIGHARNQGVRLAAIYPFTFEFMLTVDALVDNVASFLLVIRFRGGS